MIVSSVLLGVLFVVGSTVLLIFNSLIVCRVGVRPCPSVRVVLCCVRLVHDCCSWCFCWVIMMVVVMW